MSSRVDKEKRLKWSVHGTCSLSWLRMKNMDREDSADDGCSIYPDILNIDYSNKYWQIFKSEKVTFYLYSAILGIKTNKIITMSGNNV